MRVGLATSANLGLLYVSIDAALERSGGLTRAADAAEAQPADAAPSADCAAVVGGETLFDFIHLIHSDRPDFVESAHMKLFALFLRWS